MVPSTVALDYLSLIDGEMLLTALHDRHGCCYLVRTVV